MKTRQELIDAGKIYQIYYDDNPDSVFFEGNKTNCIKYLKNNSLWKNYLRGKIRLGKVIWEK